MTELKNITIDELLNPENFDELMRMAREEPTKLESLYKEASDKMITEARTPEMKVHLTNLQANFLINDHEEYMRIAKCLPGVSNE
jgi:hypothetical protein